MELQKSGKSKNRFWNAARVLLFYLCTLVILILTSGFTKNLPKDVADTTSMAAAGLLSFGLVLLFTRWNNYRLTDVGLAPGKSTVLRFAAGFAIGLSMAVIQAVVVAGIDHHLKLTYLTNFSIATILPPLMLYFLVACREELVFRSYSLRTLDNIFSPVIAITVMVSIFVLEHVIGGMSVKMAILGSGPGGILFSIAALKTKGLALPLGLHFSWNFGQWIVGFKNTPGIFSAKVDKGFETQTENLSLIVYIAIILIAIIGIVLVYRKNQTVLTKKG